MMISPVRVSPVNVMPLTQLDGLPPFQRLRGLVPDELLDALPQDDVEAVGWRASTLMQPGRDAEGNSGAPSPSPETPAPMTAG
jgi:hypothetical protein